MPSRRTGHPYATAAVIAVVGFTVAPGVGRNRVVGLTSQIRDLPRSAITGELTVDAEEPDGYVVYYESFEADEPGPYSVSVPDPAPTTTPLSRRARASAARSSGSGGRVVVLVVSLVAPGIIAARGRR